MSSGVYGTNVPSIVDSSMVDIFYSFHETRNSDSTENAVFKKLPSTILSDVVYDGDGSTDNVIEGLYNLKLPLENFSQKGFYTVYVKPKEMLATIADVSSLSAYPNVRGLVIDTTTIRDNSFRNKSIFKDSIFIKKKRTKFWPLKIIKHH